MTRPVLLDNTVLFNFASVGRSDLVLESPFEQICTTPAVKAEYKAGVAKEQVTEASWESLREVELTSKETELAENFSHRLGPV